MTQFEQGVLEVVRKIPKGSTLSYKQVAELSGHPRAYRAVGNVVKRNYDDCVPCHRIILPNGQAGHYNRGDAKKIQLLKKEGALFRRPSI